MVKPKINVLTLQVISERNYKRLGIDTIQENSELNIIDFTFLLQPSAFEEQLKSRRKGLNTIFIKNQDELNNIKENLENCDLIISMLGIQSEFNNFIFKVLKPFEKKICIVNISAVPTKPLNLKYFIFKKLYCRILSEKYFFINKSKKLLFMVMKLFSKKITLKPGYLFVCGEEVINSYSNIIDTKTKIIKSCSYDYILSNQVGKRFLNYKYFVFLDEYTIKHSDYKMLNRTVDKEDLYYKDLNRFFHDLENSFKIKVVIASHPRADLEYNIKKFPEFEVYKGITPQLIKYSEGCILHRSTSVNFAVIFDKPTLFITTHRMQRRSYENELVASWFNKKPMNISRPFNYKEVLINFKINKKYTNQYLKKYISFSKEINFGFKPLINFLETDK